MSKTLENLITKALKTGYANVNGRMRYRWGVSELESKYQVRYDQETGEFELDHWGTNILKLGSLKGSRPQVRDYYGQSATDARALRFVFDWFDLPYSASYRPSVDEFSVTADFGMGQIETRVYGEDRVIIYV